jgi:hypothetical protein
LLVTDYLRSYASAFLRLRPYEQELRTNNRVENTHHVGDDESARCSGSSRHDPLNAFSPPVHNNFNVQRHLVFRATLRNLRVEANTQWQDPVTAA